VKVALVGLPLVGQRWDPFGSIPAMPTALPTLSAWLRRAGADVQVVDGFGEAPGERFRPAPGLVARGLRPEAIPVRIDRDADLVGISVHSVAGDTVALETIRALGRLRPGLPLVVGGVHPGLMPDRFLEAGARWVVRGEGERALAAVAGLGGEAPARGVVEGEEVLRLDDLPDPDLASLPLARYWELRLGHGPVRGRHVTLSSSRGCGHGCRFCSTPALARGGWRAQSAERVVEAMERLRRDLGVEEVHFEDDDFAADPARLRRLCRLLLDGRGGIPFSLPSGVRSEPLDVETVQLLGRAGCRYLSLAPESGSGRVLRAMGKPLDLDHLVTIAAAAVRSGIRVGCFLVLGYPSESQADRARTAELGERLVAAGVDDLSVFIWSPLPGAESFGLERGWERPEELCWTPRWRASYGRLEGARIGIYLRALRRMIGTRPSAVGASAVRVLRAEQRTKGEMTVSRMLRWRQ
jgi:anaerobic magnesium-protoporphyrin IX monomethyl ester cyclase